MTQQRLEKRKNYQRLVPSFYFVSFVLNVIVFLYNGLKQSLILQIKPNHLLQVSFCHRNLIYVYLKKYLALYVERLGYEFVVMLVTFVCILYFALQICINPTRDTFLISRWKKKLTKFVYTSSIIPSGKTELNYFCGTFF